MATAEPSTLVELLATQARVRPEAIAFSFAGAATTFGALAEDASRFASGLNARGVVPGDRIVLAIANGPEFFTAFYGGLRAGAIAVPIFPKSGADRILAFAKLCDARAVVIASDRKPLAGSTDRQVLTVGETATYPMADDLFQPDPQATCFMQYTSGSTGNPKGVCLSHANLLTNIRQMITGMKITEREVFVSWLPVYHDMGLILMTMVPFYLAARLILLPTSLAGIRHWMRAISDHRGTFTAAPDFAYRLCLKYVSDPGSFDLTSLRVALNAAEPVRASTVAEFEATFALANVMVPGYGLAEATVGVAMACPGTAIKVDERGLVAIGTPFPAVEIRIAAENQGAAEPGEVGEILVKSPANTSGYHANPRQTSRLDGGDGFIRSGDLGYHDCDGNVFIVGRKKNIIIHGGQNIAPQEVEETVDSLPFVRSSAAVGIDRGRLEGEQVYVFCELRASESTREQALKEFTVTIVQCFHSRLGFRPGRVYLLKPRSIPLTANGKVQHAILKQRFTDASLRAQGRILYPGY